MSSVVDSNRFQYVCRYLIFHHEIRMCVWVCLYVSMTFLPSSTPSFFSFLFPFDSFYVDEAFVFSRYQIAYLRFVCAYMFKKWRRKFHTGSNMVWLHRCGIRTTLTAISLFFGWLCGKCESTRKGRRAHRLTDMTEISTHTHIHIHRKVQILCWTAYCNAIIPKVLSFAII